MKGKGKEKRYCSAKKKYQMAGKYTWTDLTCIL